MFVWCPLLYKHTIILNQKDEVSLYILKVSNSQYKCIPLLRTSWDHHSSITFVSMSVHQEHFTSSFSWQFLSSV